MEKILFLFLGRINIITMFTLQKATHRFSAMPVKMPVAFFSNLEKLIKFIWKYRRLPKPRQSRTNKNLEESQYTNLTMLEQSMVFSTNSAEKIGSTHAGIWNRTPFYTRKKHQLKIQPGSKSMTWHSKSIEENIVETRKDIGIGKDFHEDPRSTENERKKREGEITSR